MREESDVQLINRLIRLSVAGLPKMRRAGDELFSFRSRRTRDGLRLEGTSLRYSTIAVLGALKVGADQQRAIFGGMTAIEYCERLVEKNREFRNLGDAALLLWAASEANLETGSLIDCVLRLVDADAIGYVVEHAWVLSGLVAAQARDAAASKDVERARLRLLGCFSTNSCIFPHSLEPERQSRWRRHVGCFADQVYPIQALARDYSLTHHQASLDAAAACAAKMCELQGDQGQWWWHYDARNGSVVEGYPVYTVHQDAMGPMALIDLHEAGGPDFHDNIISGLRWMLNAPEQREQLIREDLGLIWRSVRRAEPSKFVRKVRAGASAIVESARLNFLDAICPPTRIDYEDRPYHLGWILRAFGDKENSQFSRT